MFLSEKPEASLPAMLGLDSAKAYFPALLDPGLVKTLAGGGLGLDGLPVGPTAQNGSGIGARFDRRQNLTYTER